MMGQKTQAGVAACALALSAGCVPVVLVASYADGATGKIRATPGSLVYRDLDCTFTTQTETSQFRALEQHDDFKEASASCRSMSSCVQDCSERGLYYFGTAKGVRRFMYREFSNGIVRPAFDAVIEYDAQNPVIAFRELRFKVVAETPEHLMLEAMPSQ